MESGKIRDWLEIIATLSVFAGLLLLVQEIRVNTRAVALQAQVDRSAVLAEPFFQSEELRAASQKISAIEGLWAPEAALADQYDLTAEEAIVWNRHLLQLWSLIEATYEYEDRELAEGSARVLLSTRNNRIFVEHYGQFGDDFDSFLRAILAEYDDSAGFQ
jgi:hypothetical protein